MSSPVRVETFLPITFQRTKKNFCPVAVALDFFQRENKVTCILFPSIRTEEWRKARSQKKIRRALRKVGEDSNNAETFQTMLFCALWSNARGNSCIKSNSKLLPSVLVRYTEPTGAVHLFPLT
jgi:hypothetical protein